MNTIMGNTYAAVRELLDRRCDLAAAGSGLDAQNVTDTVHRVWTAAFSPVHINIPAIPRSNVATIDDTGTRSTMELVDANLDQLVGMSALWIVGAAGREPQATDSAKLYYAAGTIRIISTIVEADAAEQEESS